jgi:hypothetical protein
VKGDNDGGRAFPVLHTIDGNWVKEPCAEHSGMSLRDYFAAKALPAVLAEMWGMGTHDSPIPPTAARFAYKVADAMLKARATGEAA